jgi:hypothetical protein
MNMSLNWNARAMTERGISIWCQREANGWEEAGEYLNPITDALIWATMVVGCDGTKIDTFIKRIREYEIASGRLIHAPQPEHRDEVIKRNIIRADSFTDKGYISQAELRRHEGLSTNASKKTDAQWAKHLASLVADKAKASLNRELRSN